MDKESYSDSEAGARRKKSNQYVFKINKKKSVFSFTLGTL